MKNLTQVNRSFVKLLSGKESKLDRLQTLLAKYDLKVSILDITGTFVQIADCSYSDYIVARSVLAEQGFQLVKG
jgi:hypothetical protein